ELATLVASAAPEIEASKSNSDVVSPAFTVVPVTAASKSISASDVAPPSADNATDNATHRLPGSEVAVRVPVAPAPTASVATERRPQPAPEATSSAMTVIPPGVVIVASVSLTCDHVFHHTKSCRSAWSPGVTDGAVIVVP